MKSVRRLICTTVHKKAYDFEMTFWNHRTLSPSYIMIIQIHFRVWR